MQLRGARHGVLKAVLELLCGWNRISDDAIRLSQIADSIAASGGRRYDLKTIGRALASLAIDELIAYTPARGRGNHARIEIHSQFVEDVEILHRDETGRVVVPQSVTFSETHTSYKPKANYPPTPQRSAEDAHSTRPSEVKVNPAEVRHVLANLPAEYQDVPLRIRWRLGGLIRRQLSRGWLPDQILTVLAAPLPAGVQRPLRLAMWRLSKNQIGSGPRLAPLQRAWDRRAEAAKTAATADSASQWLAEVTAVTTSDQRERLLRAAAVKFGIPHNPTAAIAAAARTAVREYPELALGDALQRWTHAQVGDATDDLPPAAVYETDADIATLMAIACVIGRCVDCQAASAQIRHDLPMPIPVCDDCWTDDAATDAEMTQEIAA
ncbi:hypothetical protein [Mycolicibacterium fortuitum]|uniref:hypothetical protein n=1 Tax=Mycolicibacterium fortuitum TaxID=1766 RepID=UPI003AAF5D4E